MLGGVRRIVIVWGPRSFDDGDSYTFQLKDLDTSDSTFDRPDLSAFTRLDGLGLEVTSQRIEPAPGRAVLQQLGSMTPGAMMGVLHH